MPQDLNQSISATKNTIVSLLFTDLALALTFLQTARISEQPETKERNIANALTAYQQVSTKMLRIEMSPEARQALQRELNHLAEQLIELGQRV